ncbi:MAG: cell division protein FtsQ [Pyrinomonadaceae bacterium]|nr:cell division protein FtsQ [Phycisphaerales bacterium]
MPGDQPKPDESPREAATAREQAHVPSEPSRWRRRLSATIRVLTSIISILLLAAMVVGVVIGRGPLLAEASLLKQETVRVTIEWPLMAPSVPAPADPDAGQLQHSIRHAGLSDKPATWLDAGSQASLLKLAHDSLTGLADHPFDVQFIERTQRAMMETGWFASPCRVFREPDGHVVIRGQWRQPAAAVRFGDHDYLVSTRGERLPPDYAPEGSGLKVLIGPEIATPAVGDLWLGGDIQAGLALLDCLRNTPIDQRRDVLDQVHAIDISEFSKKKRLIIVTDTGSRIMWGGEPGTFVPGQAPVTEKLDRLAKMIRKHGRIDATRDYLDISLAGVY